MPTTNTPSLCIHSVYLFTPYTSDYVLSIHSLHPSLTLTVSVVTPAFDGVAGNPPWFGAYRWSSVSQSTGVIGFRWHRYVIHVQLWFFTVMLPTNILFILTCSIILVRDDDASYCNAPYLRHLSLTCSVIHLLPSNTTNTPTSPWTSYYRYVIPWIRRDRGQARHRRDGGSGGRRGGHHRG